MSADRAVPILEFHAVGAAPESTHLAYLHMSTERLRAHFRVLRVLGLRGVSLSEATRHLDGGRSGRVVALTFDDGYQDVYANALPLLLDHGFTATCFAVSARVGDHNTWDSAIPGSRWPLMTASQLLEWHAAGMEVGAHTRTHAHLLQCTDESLREEVRGCRDELEHLVGAEVTQFCYPWGEHDDRVVEAVREAGFTAAVTIRRARARPSDDRLRLPRLAMLADRHPLHLLRRLL